MEEPSSQDAYLWSRGKNAPACMHTLTIVDHKTCRPNSNCSRLTKMAKLRPRLIPCL